MKILLIGSSGLVGKNIIKFFPMNILIHAMYNKNKSSIKKKNIKYKKLNLISNNEVKNFKSYNFDGVIDCGWLGVYGSLRNDQIQKKNEIYTNNLIKLINKISKKNKIKFFISFGSQAEYGIKQIPTSETSKLRPQTLYGKEKVKKLKKLEKYCKLKNIRFVWFRIFSCYGDFELQDWLIPYGIKNMILKKPLKFTFGLQKWDYLHVKDIVSAVLIACKNQKLKGVFNLSSNKPIKIKTIIMKIKKITNYKKKIEFGKKELRKDQVMLLNGINEKLKQFNWKPKISLDQGLKQTVSIFKKKLI